MKKSPFREWPSRTEFDLQVHLGFPENCSKVTGTLNIWASTTPIDADQMAKRRIEDPQLLKWMRMSERQLFDWQQSRPESERSLLLKLYFRLLLRQPVERCVAWTLPTSYLVRDPH